MSDEQDYETNAYEVRNAKDKRMQARRAKTLKAKRTARQKKLDRWLAANDYTAHDMWSWLSRYGHSTGRGFSTEEAKQARIDRGKRGAAVAAVKRRFCLHDKKAPKLRASGKNAGLWCCPSCHAVVPEPKKQGEDLVV